MLKLGPGPISQALEAKNPWQALKVAASKPSTMFRWILPTELEAYVQQRSSERFGASVNKPKTKKAEGAKVKAPPRLLQVDPLQLQIASGSFVTSDSVHLCQLAFEEVASEAEGLAFCTASQLAQVVLGFWQHR